MQKKIIGYSLLFPSVVGFVLFYLFPAGKTIWYSVSFGIGRREFVGLRNFKELFLNEMFILATKNTLRFLMICIPILLVLSLVLAILMKKHYKLSQWCLVVYFFPMLMPISAVAINIELLWGKTGIWGIMWSDTSKAFWILCILYIWKFFGYHALIFYAKLQTIPQSYYDYAKLLGVNSWDCLRYITMPQIMPILLLNILFALMNAFKCYREAFLIGGNYPNESIYMIQHFLNNNFQNLDYQKISAVSVLMLIICVFCLLDAYGAVSYRRRKLCIRR